MKKKYLLCVLSWFCIAISFSQKAFCWGADGHRWILKQAVGLLNEDTDRFYKTNLKTISAKVMDPDYRKDSVPHEASAHFIDLEKYFKKGFKMDALPWSKKSVKDRMKSREIDRNGWLPWAITDTYNKLVEALKADDQSAAIVLASDLAHYVGDAHQPLHTTDNYDGAKTMDTGLHARFEIELVKRYLKMIPPPDGKIEVIQDPLGFTFREIKTSHEYVKTIMAVEKTNKRFRRDEDIYYKKMWEGLDQVLFKSLQQGALALAAYFHSAALAASQ